MFTEIKLEKDSTFTRWRHARYTVLKVIDFPRYNMKCSGENVILRGIVSGFPLHFMFYRGNFESCPISGLYCKK